MLHGTCYEVLEGGPSATCQTRGFTRAQTPLCVCIQIPGGAEKQTEVKRISMESKSMLCKETDSCMRMVLSVEKNGNETYYGSPPRHHTRSQTPIEKGSQTPVCARIRTPGTDDRSQTKIKRIVAVSQGITTAHRGTGSTFVSETPNKTRSQIHE